MTEAEANITRHYLHASTIIVSAEPSLITTVLGSCISVCLFDPVSKVGGMNHFMLPLWNGRGLASPRFGNIAMEKLVKNMREHGVPNERMIAKVFGGANQSGSRIDIGMRNSRVAFEMLDQMNIQVVGKSIGGHQGRKIIFDTLTGQVRMKFINTSYNQ